MMHKLIQTLLNLLSPPSNPEPEIPIPKFRPGLYQHFKGGQYLAITTAQDSETENTFVFYAPIGNDNTEFWIRPLTMFNELAGPTANTPRFTFVRQMNESEITLIQKRIFNL